MYIDSHAPPNPHPPHHQQQAKHAHQADTIHNLTTQLHTTRTTLRTTHHALVACTARAQHSTRVVACCGELWLTETQVTWLGEVQGLGGGGSGDDEGGVMMVCPPVENVVGSGQGGVGGSVGGHGGVGCARDTWTLAGRMRIIDSVVHMCLYILYLHTTCSCLPYNPPPPFPLSHPLHPLYHTHSNPR